ncbi:MAG: efflux RND transporter periplasmic adaptor subunit [Nitrospira sp.]
MQTRMKLIAGATLVLVLGCGATIFSSTLPSQGQLNQDPPVARDRSVDVVPIELRRLETSARLPGELVPYLAVDMYPKIVALLNWIGIDRGDDVREGQVLARLTAPELRSQRAEAEAKLRADHITLQHLHTAATTPGVIAENDVEVAGKTVEASRARVNALKELEEYLTITAPFAGRITERHAHPGALLTPGQGKPLFRLEQINRLRLIIPVPEANVGEIGEGLQVLFTVSAYPGERFTGVVRRIARSVDVKTRTMPVELDVDNSNKRLAPGMFADVDWPVHRSSATIFVPRSAIVVTTEQTFVIRVSPAKTAEWIPIRRGEAMGDLQEVFGEVTPHDLVVRQGTDELRPGTTIVMRRSEPSSDWEDTQDVLHTE